MKDYGVVVTAVITLVAAAIQLYGHYFRPKSRLASSRQRLTAMGVKFQDSDGALDVPVQAAVLRRTVLDRSASLNGLRNRREAGSSIILEGKNLAMPNPNLIDPMDFSLAEIAIAERANGGSRVTVSVSFANYWRTVLIVFGFVAFGLFMSSIGRGPGFAFYSISAIIVAFTIWYLAVKWVGQKLAATLVIHELLVQSLDSVDHRAAGQ